MDWILHQQRPIFPNDYQTKKIVHKLYYINRKSAMNPSRFLFYRIALTI
ncbi:DUF4035 domain-containing protein [Mangrovimonas sp. DI 80]